MGMLNMLKGDWLPTPPLLIGSRDMDPFTNSSWSQAMRWSLSSNRCCHLTGIVLSQVFPSHSYFHLTGIVILQVYRTKPMSTEDYVEKTGIKSDSPKKVVLQDFLPPGGIRASRKTKWRFNRKRSRIWGQFWTQKWNTKTSSTNQNPEKPTSIYCKPGGGNMEV